MRVCEQSVWALPVCVKLTLHQSPSLPFTRPLVRALQMTSAALNPRSGMKGDERGKRTQLNWSIIISGVYL